MNDVFDPGDVPARRYYQEQEKMKQRILANFKHGTETYRQFVYLFRRPDEVTLDRVLDLIRREIEAVEVED